MTISGGLTSNIPEHSCGKRAIDLQGCSSRIAPHRDRDFVCYLGGQIAQLHVVLSITGASSLHVRHTSTSGIKQQNRDVSHQLGEQHEHVSMYARGPSSRRDRRQ